MSDDKTPPPHLESTSQRNGTRRRLSIVWVLLGCAWVWIQYQKDSTPYTKEPEALCAQPDALIPEQNLYFWTALGDTLATERVQSKSCEIGWEAQTETFDDMGPVGEDPRWENRGAFHDYLANAFPLVHSNLQLTKVNTYGLLYTWKGYDATLKPTLFAAHQDVVPVNPETIDQWAHPPYSGHFDGERIWGRGSSDDKSGLVGILSAIEILIEAGFQPARTMILPFGFDEEGGGRQASLIIAIDRASEYLRPLQGAGELAKYLLDIYGEHSFAFIIDEGGGFMEQFGTAFATPGVAEKGSMNVNIEVATAGGHSSVPPPNILSAFTSIGILSSLLVHIEDNPFNVNIERETPMYELFQCFAAMRKIFQPLFAKLLGSPLPQTRLLRSVEKYLFEDPVFKSLVGTTQAIDIIQGGVKSNALPEQAFAVVNHRIATTSSGKATQDHDRDLLKPLADKFNLTYVAFGEQQTLVAPHYLEPAPITPTKGPHSAPYQVLSGTIKATYNAHRSLSGDNIAVGPGMPSGNTDTRFYWDLTEHVFRYNHHNSGKGTNPLAGAHTVNESIPQIPS
ncbi:hypothetical protein VNI00_000277 [Paramarasmius palmivorus]|uniref:Peptidase M20 dimerisation domain-containing protein n=1 Tax=Paramarasmius palmivorus TaxID=297713 RepID=A0AAW0EEF8_9AGAR